MAIVRVALPVATDQLFDYWLPAGLAVETGSVLRVMLAQRRMLGVAMDLVDASDIAPERLAPIDEVVTGLPPLPEDLRTLGRFVSDYYQQPIGQCLAMMLPPLVTKRNAREALAARYRLTPEGRLAVALRDAKPGSRLRQLQEVLDSPGGAAPAALRACGAHAWRTFATWRSAGLVEAVVPAPAATSARLATLNADQAAAL